MDKFKEQCKFFINKGLFHILGTNVINYIICFFTNIFIVRFLTKEEYGVFSFANNSLSFFIILSGLGLISGLLQFCSEKRTEGEKLQLFKYGLLVGIGFNFILAICIFIYSVYGNVAIVKSKQYITQLMFLPLFMFAFEFITILFRVGKENKKYARLLNINTITYFILACSGAYIYGIAGTIAGRYISYIFSICIGIWMYKDNVKKLIKASKLKKRLINSLMKYSIICCLSNSISQLLYLLDVQLLGVFTLNEQVIASYKIATTIPVALSFIPSSIMIFIYPYFTEKNTDYIWINKNVKKLFKILALINLVISCILFVGAPLIINIFFGKEYSESILPFRILAINFFFLSTFRIPCGNILAMMRKVNVNLIINIVAGIANIVLDIVLIKLYGSVGAAIATLIVVIISSAIGYIYLASYLNKKTKIKPSMI